MGQFLVWVTLAVCGKSVHRCHDVVLEPRQGFAVVCTNQRRRIQVLGEVDLGLIWVSFPRTKAPLPRGQGFVLGNYVQCPRLQATCSMFVAWSQEPNGPRNAWKCRSDAITLHGRAPSTAFLCSWTMYKATLCLLASVGLASAALEVDFASSGEPTSTSKDSRRPATKKN